MGPGFESLKVHQKFVLLLQRVHLFPFRTQKLSSVMPTILGWRRPGKIGQREHHGEGNFAVQYLIRAIIAEGPPVPIPNTEVKLSYADNT